MGSKKVVTRNLVCTRCKVLTPHILEIKNIGTPDKPIYRYKTICTKCHIVRYLPKEPPEGADLSEFIRSIVRG
ncbi:MAG: hypothetical protein ACTSWV_03045 [Candidatus Asgardarchaeia archaeon]